MQEDDGALYRRYLGGDEEALRQLLVRYREGLTLFIYGIIGDMDEAEELMIDSFAVLAARDRVFEGRSSLKTWLFSIGRHKAISLLRRRKFEFIRFREEDTGQGADSAPGSDDAADAPASAPADEAPDFQVLQDERNGYLFRALGELPPDYRQALMLSFFEGMPCRDAAQVMGKTSRQYSDLLYRGKLSLKAILEREGFEYA